MWFIYLKNNLNSFKLITYKYNIIFLNGS
jgi:hypothetical protein